jgi:hypothetical protein
MKLIWHIAQKDLVRLRGWIALRTLVLVATVVAGWLARAGWVANWTQLMTLVTTLQWIDLVLVFVITLLLVQEDRVAGAEPFWVTRPMSGGRLLGAKLLAALVAFVGLSTLIMLPWWLACGFGSEDVGWAVAEIVLSQLAIVLPAALVSALTDSFARAMLWTLVLAMAAVSSVALWGFFVAGRSMYPGTELVAMRTACALGVLALTVSAVVAWQFFTRRTVQSLLMFGGGLMLAMVVIFQWPDAWVPRKHLVEINAGVAAGVALSFESAGATMPTPGKPVWLTIGLKATGVPDDLLLSVQADTQVWRWPDGMKLEREGWTTAGYRSGGFAAMRAVLGLPEQVLDAETERYWDDQWLVRREKLAETRRAQGISEPLPQRRPGSLPAKQEWIPLWGNVVVPMSLAQRLRTEPARYESKLWLQLTRPEVWAESLLQPGGWMNRGAHCFRVTASTREVGFNRGDSNQGRYEHQLRLALTTTEPATLREDWEWFSYLLHERLAHQKRDITYCVSNPRLGRLETLRFVFREARVGFVKISSGDTNVVGPTVSRNGKWVEWQPSWRDDTKLVIFGWREESQFSRDMKVGEFRVRP